MTDSERFAALLDAYRDAIVRGEPTGGLFEDAARSEILNAWAMHSAAAETCFMFEADARDAKAETARLRAEVERLREVILRVYSAELDDARERYDAERLMESVLFPEVA